MMPILAIVGRPNVGKSTLFNRLIGERKALVMDTPGVTRDRNYGRAEHNGVIFTVIDTGGFEPNSEEGMLPAMRAQAELAIQEAHAILFMVDGRDGLTPIDEQVFDVLRNADRPVFVVVNKIEGRKQDTDVMEFYGLGVENLYPISAEHALGLDDVLDPAVASFPEFDDPDADELRTRIAVVGRPNAGKSTLINRILGANRLIVSDVAGTTRDSIDSTFDVGDKHYTLIDTVGMRRKRSIGFALEKLGVMKAMHSIERSHVAVVVIDAVEGLADQDARIANLAVKNGRALIMVLNKWDAVEKDNRTADQMIKTIREERASLRWAPILTMSALTGQRVNKLLEFIDEVRANAQRRIPTSQLNRWFENVIAMRPPPLYKKRATKLYYATQARVSPPTFVFQSNMAPDGIPTAYTRYLENQLRESYEFAGTPIRILIRQRKSKYQDMKPDDEPKRMKRSRPPK